MFLGWGLSFFEGPFRLLFKHKGICRGFLLSFRAGVWQGFLSAFMEGFVGCSIRFLDWLEKAS